MNNFTRNSRIVTGAICVFLSACTKPASPTRTEKARQEAKEAVQSVRTYSAEQMAEYQGAAQEKIRELDQSIDKLGARAEAAKKHGVAEIRSAITDLKEKKTTADLKLQDLKTATREAWHDMKEGVDAAVDELQKAYEAAARRLKD